MSETYWLLSTSAPTAELSDALSQAMHRAGIQPQWILERHQIGNISLPEELPTPAACYAWPVQQPAAQRLLNLLISSVQRNDPELLLIIEQLDPHQPCTAALLGSPSAAGRRNLLPQARLHTETETPTESLSRSGLLLPLHQAIADQKSGSLSFHPALFTYLEVL